MEITLDLLKDLCNQFDSTYTGKAIDVFNYVLLRLREHSNCKSTIIFNGFDQDTPKDIADFRAAAYRDPKVSFLNFDLAEDSEEFTSYD